ncbi:hypothetical protein PARMER_03586 [Parabacteroides merdae ATCC 43184]|nr:hypothetical protein PARMER_03586 [Parabacteroides merdae ATCC 43184]
MSYKGEGRQPDCLHLKNLPSPVSPRFGLAMPPSSHPPIYIK